MALLDFADVSKPGKSTMVNGLVNYLLGVKWDEDRRFKIDMAFAISGEESYSSQTKWVSGYTINNPEHGIITIVDTPGFADTGGMDIDAFIPEQIRTFFRINDMKKLSGVGLVVSAAQARLTPAEKYVYHSCLKMFGNDVTENLYVVFTFSDCSEPPALEAIKVENIPYRDYFQVNNSGLYSANKPKEVTSFAKLYWDMGVRGFRKLCTSLSTITPVNLALTSEVMAEQDVLDGKVTELKIQLENSFQELIALEKKEKELLLNPSRSSIKRILCEAQLTLTRTLNNLNDSLLQLDRSSMKSLTMTVLDYIQLHIDAELQERTIGYKERLRVLNEAKIKAEKICRSDRSPDK
ncbi:unnamed protein product [Darwinula stevensoni]|uniref:AIG1-type G domain-containing protein n=1 Tax=Darwinula stevensoni TaxID=69355 RepID=A0A7R9AGB4_9CRUS|nr:unnamed protein product [Darwinula stevensoni]CAG0903262.1 unnamed protein product [Darwinula stevensoni]